jgi:hypothetical protein
MRVSSLFVDDVGAASGLQRGVVGGVTVGVVGGTRNLLVILSSCTRTEPTG